MFIRCHKSVLDCKLNTPRKPSWTGHGNTMTAHIPRRHKWRWSSTLRCDLCWPVWEWMGSAWSLKKFPSGWCFHIHLLYVPSLPPDGDGGDDDGWWTMDAGLWMTRDDEGWWGMMRWWGMMMNDDDEWWWWWGGGWCWCWCWCWYWRRRWMIRDDYEWCCIHVDIDGQWLQIVAFFGITTEIKGFKEFVGGCRRHNTRILGERRINGWRCQLFPYFPSRPEQIGGPNWRIYLGCGFNQPAMFGTWFELYKCACLGHVEQSQRSSFFTVIIIIQYQRTDFWCLLLLWTVRCNRIRPSYNRRRGIFRNDSTYPQSSPCAQSFPPSRNNAWPCPRNVWGSPADCSEFCMGKGGKGTWRWWI